MLKNLPKQSSMIRSLGRFAEGSGLHMNSRWMRGLGAIPCGASFHPVTSRYASETLRQTSKLEPKGETFPSADYALVDA